MRLFTYDLRAVRSQPFAHVVADAFLDPDAYREMARSFPSCPPNSGPTGYSLFWGDAAYEDLLRQHAVWRSFFAQTQSQEFVDYVLKQFEPTFAAEAVVDLSHARFISHRESRTDKEKERLAQTGLAPDDLFIRTDILQGNIGYARQPHVDHRRRAASMLIYFCDGDDAAMSGGDLVLSGRGAAKEETIRPRHNRMVMFPCCNDSVHAVTRITAQAAPRNFVQISVSGSVDLWEPLPRPALSLASRISSRLRGAFGA